VPVDDTKSFDHLTQLKSFTGSCLKEEEFTSLLAP